ncbi:MAG: sigma-70 family RNA polymerase sigma factor [Flavobacteriales bacterium]|nr:sigma-70 family RNA polymerase sigma factor [Flavobacteriales bacterium]
MKKTSEISILKPANWVENYADYLYSYAIIKVNDDEKAKDLVQDTFVSAIENQNTFRGQSVERTWLTSILKNKIIDYYRKMSTKNEIRVKESDEEYEHRDSFFETVGSNEGMWNPDARPQNWSSDYQTPVENEEFYTILQACLGKLPQKWAMVFSLKSIDGYSSKEICKELNLSASNYWVLMHRAKLQLRGCMEINWFNS